MVSNLLSPAAGRATSALSTDRPDPGSNKSRSWSWALLLFAVLGLCQPVAAQTPTLEFAAGAGNPTGNGPTIANQVITFQNNTNNPTGNTFAAYIPTTTATFTLDNQQYTNVTTVPTTNTGASFGTTVNPGGTSALPITIFPLMNSLGASANANYTSAGGLTGGIDIAANRSIYMFTSAQALARTASTAPTTRYQFADLTITFSQPVNNPVIHVTGLGGAAETNMGFTTELDLLSSGVTLSKLDGSTELSVNSTQILNTATSIGTATGSGAASGSVLVTTSSPVTVLKFRLYVRSDGRSTTWYNTNTTQHAGDGWLIGVSTLSAPVLTGTVFEDVNYGGGAGRPSTVSGAATVANATVELYTSAGTFVRSTTTDADGKYSFNTANGAYIVRVVNSSISSSRTGYVAGLLPVQTYNGTTTAVGGQQPSLNDAPANSGSQLLATLTSTTATPQSIAAVTTTGLATAGPEFGFNYDLVVNTKDAGQGSLRQFITNSNALGGEATLAQVYTSASGATTALTTGRETSVFMIPNGSAVAGQVAGLTSQFSAGVATIALASGLPAVTGASTAIDGSTQTRSTGNTNPVVTTAGAESTGPEIVIDLNNNTTGINFSNSDEVLNGVAVINVRSNASGIVLNAGADGFTLSNNTIYNNGVNVSVLSGVTGATINNNVIRGSLLANAGGIVSQNGTSGNVFSQNTYGGNNGLAIDLTNGTTFIGDGVTLNDNGDADTGANGLPNYPIITSATLTGSSLTITGFARAGAKIELYSVGTASDPSGFGEGQVYLGTVTEGGAAGGGNLATDTNSGTNLSYSGFINGVNQGSDNSTNGFTFVIPVSSLTGGTLAARTILSSTATVGGATSEFSGNIIVRDLTVANDDQATTPLNTAVTFVVTGNDTPTADINNLTIDLDPTTAGIQTTFTVTGQGTFTTAGVTAGSVKFTPVTGFVGVSDIPYTVQNASGATSNQANLIVKVESQLDLATTIATSTATVVAGNAVTLTGVTSNNSLAGTSNGNVVQKIQLPPGLTGTVSYSQSGNGGGVTNVAITSTTYATNGGVLVLPTITLAAGASSNYSVTFNAPLSGSFTATAFVEPTAGDVNLTNNSASVNVTVTPKLDLFTTINGPSGVLPQNSLFNYTVTTGNSAASSPATGVVQTVEVPASSLITGVFATNGGVYNAAAGTVTFPPVDLAAGQVVTNTVSFVVPATNITVNAVRATVPTTNDVATGNNAATASSVSTQTVAPVDPRANLYTVISGPAQANPGAATQYTVRQGTNGPNAASNVKTIVSAPAGLSTAGITVGGTTGTLSGNTITFGSGATYDVTTGIITFPTITSQANGAAEQSYVFTITPSGATQSISLTASVSSATADNVPADNMSTVATEIRAVTDIAVTVSNASGAGNLTAGQTAIYEIQTQNVAASGLTALDVQQRVSLPAGLSAATLKLNGATGTQSGFVITFGSGATASTYNVNTGLLTLPLVSSMLKGTLLTNTVSFPVSGTSTGTGVRVVASATTSTPESDLTNNNAAAGGTGINSVEDLTVAVSGPTQALIGNPVLYTVTTTNNGPSSTGTVSTVVQLPVGLTNVEVRDNTGTVVAGAYSATTGLVTYPTTTTMPTVGQSVQGTISFLAPDVNQISLAASVGITSPSTGNSESNLDNNSARISTVLAAPSLGSTDLVTTITAAQSGSIAPGAVVGFTVTTNNASTVVAQNPTQLVSLPVGLSAASLFVGSQAGTLSAGVITFPNGATYNVSTGLLTVSLGASLNAGASQAIAISYPMPAAEVTLTALSSSTNPESTPANNVARANTPTSPMADIVLGVSGSTLAASGSTVSYSVLATNSGPSTASSVTVRFTLPTGVSSYTVNGTTTTIATTTAPTQVTLFPSGNTLLNGASLSYQVSFAAPSASFSVAANVTTTTIGDDTGNNNGTVNTNVNIAPLANDVVNALQTPEGNTATAKLPLTPLSATDADGTVVSYKLTSLPNSGTLYYNGTPAAINTAYTNPALFSFTPTASFVGSVFFTYTATDNGNGTPANALTSPVARYTIQVGQDNNSVYTATPAKGGATKYVTNDALAFVIDQNGAVYNNAPTTGLVYNPNGTVATGTVANGLPTTGTNAVLAPSGSGPASNPTNVLPSGVSLNPTTGLIYVSNAAALPLVRAATTYSVNVITTDVNGGTNTVTATFTIGAYPLPVELTAFTAVAKNLDAQLAWTTASEKDNDHFEVERSLNGTDFVKIAEVKGQGNSTRATDYTRTDAGIGAKANGLVYYRLKQVDGDGTTSFSPVRTVRFGNVVPAITVYPNPASSATSLDLRLLPAGAYRVSVLDAAGRVVLNTTLEAGLTHALELNTIASGSYTLLVRGENGGQVVNLTKRLIKE